ncbi:hypothetical protein M2146_001082 [Lachnospiraceae bacterium PF1-22]
MWIETQSGTLVNSNAISTISIKPSVQNFYEINVVVEDGKRSVSLGTFATKEECEDVMRKIQQKIIPEIFCSIPKKTKGDN